MERIRYNNHSKFEVFQIKMYVMQSDIFYVSTNKKSAPLHWYMYIKTASFLIKKQQQPFSRRNKFQIVDILLNRNLVHNGVERFM
jgi:hypothetical protein